MIVNDFQTLKWKRKHARALQPWISAHWIRNDAIECSSWSWHAATTGLREWWSSSYGHSRVASFISMAVPSWATGSLMQACFFVASHIFHYLITLRYSLHRKGQVISRFFWLLLTCFWNYSFAFMSLPNFRIPLRFYHDKELECVCVF